MKRFLVAFAMIAMLIPPVALASITNIATTNESDGTWYRNNWYAGSYSGFYEGGDLGTTYLYFGGADRYFEKSYMQFNLSGFAGNVADIQSVTFNFNLLGVEGSGTLGSLWHRDNSSTATGLASQLLAGNQKITDITSNTAIGWNSIDVTSMLVNDLTQGYAYSAFSSTYSSNWDLSFAIGSSESNLAPYLQIITSASAPAPASFVLLVSGLLGIAGLRRQQTIQ
ncbi:MAG: hypothetical protein ACFHX7_19025 [Pseudomonadota bacterium]